MGGPTGICDRASMAETISVTDRVFWVGCLMNQHLFLNCRGGDRIREKFQKLGIVDVCGIVVQVFIIKWFGYDEVTDKCIV